MDGRRISRMPRLLYLIRLSLLLTFAYLASLSTPTVAQETEAAATEPVLLDEFGLVGECEFGGRLDSFLAELSQKPGVRGYIINYKSAAELPGERELFSREMVIVNHMRFRNFDVSRLTIVRGGYRSEIATELWVVSAGAATPEPSRTVPEPITPEGETILFATADLDLSGDETAPNEFVLPAYIEKENARYAELNAQNAPAESADDDAEGEDAVENTAPDEETALETEDEPEPVDERTEQEKEEERFAWANVGLAKHAATRQGSRGVIIFYADDQQYDIGKLTSFIEKGGNLLAEHAELDRGRITVIFGGYRETPEVDFWFVPANGEDPLASPAERPVEQPDETEN
jgi:hypothetical protein